MMEGFVPQKRSSEMPSECHCQAQCGEHVHDLWSPGTARHSRVLGGDSELTKWALGSWGQPHLCAFMM